MVFSGRFDHTIDEKGRVSLPARFRELMQHQGVDTLHITNFIAFHEPCLVLYLPDQWQRLIGSLSQRNRFDPTVHAFEILYIGGAHEVQIDKQGRILIPPRLREFARLGRNVTFSARISQLELWDKETLKRVLGTLEAKLDDPSFLEKLAV